MSHRHTIILMVLGTVGALSPYGMDWANGSSRAIEHGPVASGASNANVPLPADIAALPLPDGVYPLLATRVANDPFYLPARLMPVVREYADATPSAQMWPPLLLRDTFFVADNDCARSRDDGSIEVVILEEKRVCREITTEADMGATTYILFRYGLETGQTLLFGMRTQGCGPFGAPGDSRFDECAKTFHTLEMVQQSADAIVRQVLRHSR